MDRGQAGRGREREVMRPLRDALVAAAATCLLAGCGGDDDLRSPQDIVIARAQGVEVTRGEWESYLRYAIHLPDEPAAEGSGDREFPEVVRSRLLDHYLVERILVARADARNIKVSEEDLDKFALETGLGNLATFYEGMPLVQRQYLKSYLTDSLRVKLLVDRETEGGIRVGDEDVRAHYDQHLDKYTRPTRYRLRAIRVDSPIEAENLRQEITGRSEVFKAVAERLTEDENEQGRDLGLWPIQKLPEAFREPILRLNGGEISEVVEDPDGGFNLILVDEKIEGGVIPFEEVRDDIRRRLERDRRYDLAQALMSQTRSSLKVEIVDENLGFDYTAPQTAAPATAPPVAATPGGA